MFKGKPTKVIITGYAKEEFDELNKVVGEEIAKGLQVVTIKLYSTQ